MPDLRLLVVNPNSTASMTDKIAAAARAVAAPDVTVIARTSVSGPPAIQGHADGVAAVPGLLNALSEAPDTDAAIIACFDDTGLSEAQALVPYPVIGIGQAAYHAASLMGRRFSVVTTLPVSVPVLEANIAAYGLAGTCARVRASDVPVLALETDPAAEARVSDEIASAIAEDGADAIVLGCAGMADLAHRLEARHGVPVIDGVAAATGLARSLAAIRHRPAT